jgi:hypothetical protein
VDARLVSDEHLLTGIRHHVASLGDELHSAGLWYTELSGR